MDPENFPSRVTRVASEDEVIARANNPLVGRAGYETAVRLYPKDVIQYWDGAGLLRGASRKRHELGMSVSWEWRKRAPINLFGPDTLSNWLLFGRRQKVGES